MGPHPIRCHQNRGKLEHIRKAGETRRSHVCEPRTEAGPDSPSATEASYPSVYLSWTPSPHNSNGAHLRCLRHFAVEVITSWGAMQLHPHQALWELVVRSPLPAATLKIGVPTDSAAPTMYSKAFCPAIVLWCLMVPGRPQKVASFPPPPPSLLPRSTLGRRQH